MNADVSDNHSENRDDFPFVIGTAGHVDHGKSTLVRALTGIDPDRLAEEKERELTIDLGFAWFSLPSGRTVSLIDVPGHERFVRNMLAGVGGVDLALLVIAADDGPMPQTREHLAILDLLGIDHGVVVVSRCDLVDNEWRDLVVDEIRELVQGTTLAHAPIVPVSAVTGDGIETLKGTLEAELEHSRARDAGGRPRLPIDRAFQVSGFGTVVTGTLIGGEVRTGRDMMLYPAERAVRIRGIQAHRQHAEQARAGSRVALNLGGIDHHEIHRGNVLALPGSLTPSMRLDARVSILHDAPMILEQNNEVVVFAGAAEVPARATLLDREQLGPGEEGWVQLRLSQPLAVLRSDRLILRRPSPAATIGGGVIVDPTPPRHKRFQDDVIATLAVLAEGTPEDLILQELGDLPVELGELARTTGVEDTQAVIDTLIEAGDVVVLTPGSVSAVNNRSIVVRTSVFDRWISSVSSFLETHHKSHALSPGVRRDDLRDVLGIRSQRPFDEVLTELERRDVLRTDGAIVAAPGFSIVLDIQQRQLADAFLMEARTAGFSPPAPDSRGISEDLLAALQATGEIVRVADQIAYPTDVYSEIQSGVVAKLERDTTITLAEYRDMFGTSRKYAQPTLEYLDERRITRRKGDVRVKYHGAGSGNE